MDIEQINSTHSKHVARLLSDGRKPDNGTLVSIWRWIDGVSRNVAHLLGSKLYDMGRILLSEFRNFAGAFTEVLEKLRGIVFWVDILIWHVVKGWIAVQRKHMLARIAALGRYLIGVIHISTQAVLIIAVRGIRAEKRERVKAVNRAEYKARAAVRALHHVIEREAASGYVPDREQRINVIISLLDFAAARNPEIRAITRDIAGALLDLLSVDNPVARLLAGFLIGKVINRLGIDKAAGTLIADLAGPALARIHPSGIHDVILDLSSRAGAAEKQWAQFFEDGGSQVEQAGRDWRDITSGLTGAAIVAFTAQAILDPALWAAEVSGTIGAVANDVALKAAALFKG